MSTERIVLAVALLLSGGLGTLVYCTNPRRIVNRAYLLLCFVIVAWLGTLLMIFGTREPAAASLLIRLASVLGASIPLVLSILRRSITIRANNLWRLAMSIPKWSTSFAAIAVYCLTRLYLSGVKFPASGIPDAVYGPAALLYPAYLIAGVIWMFAETVRDLRRASGMTRVELQYILAGLACIVVTCVFAGVLPQITHNSQIVAFAPLWLVAMNGVIAYGIATSKILSVGTLVRRATSYTLLVTYLVVVYCATWWLSSQILPGEFATHLVAAVVTALTMTRASRILQAFVRKLFINFHVVDLRETLKAVDALLQQVSTTDDLLARFVQVLSKAAGTEVAAVILLRDSGEASIWSITDAAPLRADDPLPAYMGGRSGALSLAEVSRRPTSSSEREATRQLAAMAGEIAIPFWNATKLAGVVILGWRLTGRPYDKTEVESLQLLVSRLGTAVENAELYTELRSSKHYVETILTELTSGVIAANEAGVVTVCNREAARLLNQAVVGSHIDRLPPTLAQPLLRCLETGEAVKDENGLIQIGVEEAVPVRFSLKSLADTKRGVLLVISDLTRIRKLEEQLRRADRLASLGTMAAGIAHEIKNPLQPIKTFVSLLPERSDDAAFLERFGKIVGHEVDRIDRLVFRLLSMSKPDAPAKTRMSLHDLIEDTLALLAHDFNKREIEVVTSLDAEVDQVVADRSQMEQVLLNVLLNAAEAMDKGGILTLESRMKHSGSVLSNLSSLELLVKDQGPGVPEALLRQIFDPFITTKADGTGLGLSIAHGIMADHSTLR